MGVFLLSLLQSLVFVFFYVKKYTNTSNKSYSLYIRADYYYLEGSAELKVDQCFR